MTDASEFIGMLKIVSFEFVICKHNCINLHKYVGKRCLEVVICEFKWKAYEQYCKYQQPILIPHTSQDEVKAENRMLSNTPLKVLSCTGYCFSFSEKKITASSSALRVQAGLQTRSILNRVQVRLRVLSNFIFRVQVRVRQK